MKLQKIAQMFRKPILIILLTTLLSVRCSDSLLKGEITFYGSNQVAQLRPLSQQPKIANIKNSLFEFLVIAEVDSCLPLNKSHFQREINQPPVIVVMDLSEGRQTCGMSNKIARIKEAGGYGFIIITNDNTFIINHCKMYDSNSFFTGVMNSNNFQILTSQKENPLIGSLTITPKDSKLKLLEIWTSSLSSASYDDLKMLGHVFNKLPTLIDHVEWRPRIALLGCTHGDNPNICSIADNVASCGCKGQFCSPQAHKKAPGVIVEQDIRQMLIFKQYSSKYFQYLRLFQEQCLPNYIQSSYSHDCAVNVMNKLDIDSYSINAAIQSFLDRCSDDQEIKSVSKSQIYTILEKDKNAFANYGRYPLILLNKQILQYKNQDDLAGQLCRKMSLQDEGCYEVSSRTVTTVTGALFYVLLVVILVAIGAGVVYFYRKKLKRDMNKEIKMQVSTAVEHYFALTDVK